MDIPISRAGSELDDLVRRAEAGEEVVLTRDDGEPAVRLAPLPKPEPPLTDEDREKRRAALEAILAAAAERRKSEPPFTLKEIDDEMYDEYGLPK